MYKAKLELYENVIITYEAPKNLYEAGNQLETQLETALTFISGLHPPPPRVGTPLENHGSTAALNYTVVKCFFYKKELSF